MTGLAFWTVAVGLALAVCLVLWRAMWRADSKIAGSNADLAVYRDQLAETARDLARGLIRPEEADRLRAEIGRRILEADRARPLTGVKTAASGKPLILALIIALMLPGAVLGYWRLGAPGYPDMALVPRLQALDAAISSRPGQETALIALGTPRDAGLDAKLAADLSGISDLAALRSLYVERLEKGEAQAAVRTLERLLSVAGPSADAGDYANSALALVIEAQGYVSPEAEDALRESLTRDPSNELALYLAGEMFRQGGRYDKAFGLWRPVAETGNPEAPWTRVVREQIEDVAAGAGIGYRLPETGPGPSPEDLAAAADMDPEDRQAMIETMVSGLSERLASEGGPVEDWERLIRSLAVLDRQTEAQAIYDEAKLRFEGRTQDLALLRQAALDAELAP